VYIFSRFEAIDQLNSDTISMGLCEDAGRGRTCHDGRVYRFNFGAICLSTELKVTVSALISTANTPVDNGMTLSML